MKDQIQKDLVQAMKDKDSFTLSVLRMLKSSLQLEGISLKKELDDNEVLAVIKRSIKQRKDSITEYEKYGKEDTINDLKKEIEVLEKYLPKQLSDDEVLNHIEAAFKELKPESMKDMGKVMKYLTDKIGTVADMGMVSKKVREKLNQ